MSEVSYKLATSEKFGYALGDAAANLVWRGALAFLMVFYTDVFGISPEAAAGLVLIVRLSDGVTDIIMGMIADRTTTRWGKFRPWILWSAPVLGLFMALTFSTPNLSPEWKLVYAYITYIGLTLAYTVNNVPYSALMGVMTDNHAERTSLSGWRFGGAFGGGLLVMMGTPLLVEALGGGDEARGYQYTMYLFAVLLVILLFTTFATTKERVLPRAGSGNTLSTDLWDLTKNLPFIIIPLASASLFFYYRGPVTGIIFGLVVLAIYFGARHIIAKGSDKASDTQKDLIDLLTNVPWLVILAIGFLFMMFNGIKIGATAYYFHRYVDVAAWPWGQITSQQLLSLYFGLTLAISVVAAFSTGTLGRWIGKRELFIVALVAGGLLTGAIYFVANDQPHWALILGCAAEFFAAIMPVLFFSMLGDCADYSEWKNNRRATGLIFSAGTFINKTGGGFAGALILLVLAAYGYSGRDEASIAEALPAIVLLMSWIPAGFAFIAAAIMLLYPLNDTKMRQIELDLAERRNKIPSEI